MSAEWFKCPMCSYRTDDERDIQQHIREHDRAAEVASVIKECLGGRLG